MCSLNFSGQTTIYTEAFFVEWNRSIFKRNTKYACILTLSYLKTADSFFITDLGNTI